MLATRSQAASDSAAKYHTTVAQLSELAREAKRRLLLLDHQGSVPAEEVFAEIRARYSGRFAVARGLDVY